MQKRIRSILDELDALIPERDRKSIIENRANHVIQSAINLIQMIYESYDEETAKELENRLINSIRGQNATKFTRRIRQTNSENKK